MKSDLLICEIHAIINIISVGYTMNLDDGRLIGAILAGSNSEDFPDYRGMLCVNIDDDTMMAFERRKSSTAETSAV